MKKTGKAIAFLLAVVIATGLITAYSLDAENTVTIGDFINHPDYKGPARYLIVKNDYRQTEISHVGRTPWNECCAFAEVSGYTAEMVKEYKLLCVTLVFDGVTQLAIEMPYRGLHDNLELVWCDTDESGKLMKDNKMDYRMIENADRSYTFVIPLDNYKVITDHGITGIMIFLNPDINVDTVGSMTIIDIGFRRENEPIGPQCGISFDQAEITFPTATVGYDSQGASTVKITNTKTAATGQLDIKLTGANADSFTLSKSAISSISPNGADSFTVQPKDKLSAGTYTAMIEVSKPYVPAETLRVSFTVMNENGGPIITGPSGPKDVAESKEDDELDDDTILEQAESAESLPPHSPWAEKELIRALELEIIPLSFLVPDMDLRKPISRAEFAGVAVKAYENLADTTVLPADFNTFADTQDTDVLRALNIGVMVGFSQTEFSPHTNLTREQAATVLTRVYKRATISEWSFETDSDHPLAYIRPAPFADDADISGWARDSVYFMTANGIILGVGYNVFAPRAVTSMQEAAGYALATREQAILLTLRMVEKEW